MAAAMRMSQDAGMSNLIVIGFNNEADAFEMRAALAKLQSQYLIEMEDAVVVTRDAKGKVQLHQAVNLTAAGAASGGFWGMLIGMLFLNPLLGVAIGAGSGALSGKLADIGINDQFMKDLGRRSSRAALRCSCSCANPRRTRCSKRSSRSRAKAACCRLR